MRPHAFAYRKVAKTIIPIVLGGGAGELERTSLSPHVHEIPESLVCGRA